MDRITDWKRNKLSLKQKTGRIYMPKEILWLKLQALYGKQFKTTAGREKIKSSGIYQHQVATSYQVGCTD